MEEDSRASLWSRLLRGEESDEQVEQLLSQFNDENALKLNLNTHRTAVRSPKSPFHDVDAGRLDLLGLDQELALRYSNLKAPSKAHPARIGEPGKTPKDSSELKRDGNVAEDGKEVGGKARGFLEEEEEKILGQELAARFAALKTPSPVSKVESDEKPPTGDRGFDSQEASSGAQEGKISEAEQVQKLLASVEDSIRLEKARVSSSSSSFPSKEVKEVEEASAAANDDDDDEISESEVDRLVEWAKDAARLELADSEDEEEAVDDSEQEDDGKRSIRK